MSSVLMAPYEKMDRERLLVHIQAYIEAMHQEANYIQTLEKRVQMLEARLQILGVDIYP